MLALTNVRVSGWFCPGANTSFFLVLFLVAASCQTDQYRIGYLNSARLGHNLGHLSGEVRKTENLIPPVHAPARKVPFRKSSMFYHACRLRNKASGWSYYETGVSSDVGKVGKCISNLEIKACLQLLMRFCGRARSVLSCLPGLVRGLGQKRKRHDNKVN